MRPTVSICLPNLNTRPFLPERFATIREQSFKDWELLVYDSYSNDGAWEYIQEQARHEPRMRAWQGPREGTPGSWNPCIRAATGEYVYIATSDDTMPPDCLEKLVAALEAYPECDVAHCRLRAIDENGAEIPGPSWHTSIFARSSGPLVERVHVRKAPYDGLLHLIGGNVYVSITQLLIRRSLFDRIGLFESKWGSVGDFNWGMRAGLVGNVVHVPNTWGGWRLHSGQATAGVALTSDEHVRKVEDMIVDAIAACEKFLTPSVSRHLHSRWAPETRECRSLFREVSQHESAMRRKALVVRKLFAGSPAARAYFSMWLQGSIPWSVAFPRTVERWLKDEGLGAVLLGQSDGARD